MARADDVKRVVFSIPEELYEKTVKLKQEKFFDQSWSDLYRYVVEIGLEAIEKKKKG